MYIAASLSLSIDRYYICSIICFIIIYPHYREREWDFILNILVCRLGQERVRPDFEESGKLHFAFKFMNSMNFKHTCPSVHV